MPDRLLVDADPTWPALHVTASEEEEAPAEDILTDRRAEVTLRTGGRLTLDRDCGMARFAVPRPLSDEEIVHPYLAAPAIIVSHWLGRIAFHAGGFVYRGGAWGVAGSRGAGKSSLLAALALAGHGIVADDVLVLDGATAFAGPRSVDLRAEAARRLGVGEDIGVAGLRPRLRLRLPPIAPQLPFRGWVFLAWGDAPRMVRVGPSDRLGRLLEAAALRVTPAEPERMLELAAQPAWTLERPRDWHRMGDSLRRLIMTLDGAASAS
jgi:hypothetical protein